VVGAEGFEPPAPCSQKRGEPSNINALLTIPEMFTALGIKRLAGESEILTTRRLLYLVDGVGHEWWCNQANFRGVHAML
jgi:hypothetical protein